MTLQGSGKSVQSGSLLPERRGRAGRAGGQAAAVLAVIRDGAGGP